MAETSPRLTLPYIQPAQAQKHVTHNEALQRLDAVVQLSLEDSQATTPPAVPEPGEIHALAPGATGDWAGQTQGTLAFRGEAAWIFIPPQDGWQGWDKTAGRQVVFDGTAWAPVAPDSFDQLGINSTADPTNRLVVGSDATLFTHDGTSHQVKVNKATSGDDAAHMFQTNYATHALFGLLANDDFTLKVSPDGSAFTNAIEADSASGEVHLPQGLRLGGSTDVMATYDQGDWTPTWGATTTDPTGDAYTATGKYIRIGALVLVSFELLYTSRGTGGDGKVQIRGLPFGSGGNFYSSDLRHSGVSFPGTGAPIMRSSGTALTLFSTNGSDLLWSSLPASSSFSFLGSFLYITNA